MPSSADDALELTRPVVVQRGPDRRAAGGGSRRRASAVLEEVIDATNRRWTMSKLRNVAIAALAVLAVSGPAAVAANQAMSPRLVRTIIDKQLGEVLTTSQKQAIYIWKSEQKGKIRCTGACAKAWPPVLVKQGVVVPMHYAGMEGDFGTIRRPDGSRQLTLDRRALYTYAHEKPGQVLCNNIDNWFAVRNRP